MPNKVHVPEKTIGLKMSQKRLTAAIYHVSCRTKHTHVDIF